MAREWWDLPKKRQPKAAPAHRGMLFEERWKYICNGCSTQAQEGGTIGPRCLICQVQADFRSKGGHRYTIETTAKTVKIIYQKAF